MSIKPRKLGISINLPAILLLYEDSKGNLRKRTMPLRFFTATSDVDLRAEELCKRHSPFLDKVPVVIVSKFLSIFQELLCGVPVNEAVNEVSKRYLLDLDEDLNKLPEAELKRKKQLMDVSFQKKLISPEDPGFVYDKEVEFETQQVEASAWDDDEENDVCIEKPAANTNDENFWD